MKIFHREIQKKIKIWQGNNNNPQPAFLIALEIPLHLQEILNQVDLLIKNLKAKFLIRKGYTH